MEANNTSFNQPTIYEDENKSCTTTEIHSNAPMTQQQLKQIQQQKSNILRIQIPAKNASYRMTSMSSNDFEKKLCKTKIEFTSNFKIKLLGFMLSLLQNLIVVIPLYFIITLFEMLKVFAKYIIACEFVKAIKTIFVFTVELLVPSSVIGILIQVTHSIVFQEKLKSYTDMYFYWNCQCLAFFLTIILLIAYQQTFSKEEFSMPNFSLSYILNKENLKMLGLGQIKHNCMKEYYAFVQQQIQKNKNKLQQQNSKQVYIDRLQTSQIEISVNSKDNNGNNADVDNSSSFIQAVNDKEEFNTDITEIAQELNIDLSLFFFQFMDDQVPDFSESAGLEDREKQSLKNVGFYGKRRGTTQILLPIYNYSFRQVSEEPVNYKVILFFIFLKIIFPFMLVILYHPQQKQYLTMTIISGFYLFMIIILYTTMNNQDLKRRAIIMKSINSLIDFEEEVEQVDDQGNKDVITQIDTDHKLDVTCKLSLETWDNARRIAIMIDAKKTDDYEQSYVFLGVYLIILTLLLVAIYGNVYIIVHKNAFLITDPVLVINMTIDFLLVILLFINRMFYIDKFNKNFEDQKNEINELRSVYEDLRTLYDFYFDSNILSMIGNKFYKKMVELIKEKAIIKAARNKTALEKVQYEMVHSLEASLKKLEKQVDRDFKNFTHKFLGVFEFVYESFLSTVLFAFASIMPEILKKLNQILGGQGFSQAELSL